MKLFLKRDTGDASAGFVILDESGHQKYMVTEEIKGSKQKISVTDNNNEKISSIVCYNFVIRYFSVKCSKHIYALVPCFNDSFAFAIYGSTYRFMGDISQGRFSLIDVDKSPVMTQKKCWCKYGDGYELNIFDCEQEYFALSIAICAAMYISAAEEKPVLT